MSLKMPYKVLCICLGNICRSPTAEVILRHISNQQQLPMIIDSAGTSNYHPGEVADQRSQAHALKRGYDLSMHRARQIQLEDFINFDLILAMDEQNLKDLQQLKHNAENKFCNSKILAQLAMMSEHDEIYPQQAIPDPYYGNANDFERVIDQCESSSIAWVHILKQKISV